MNKLHSILVGLSLLFVFPGMAKAGMTPQRSVLENGLVLLTSEQKALPMVALELLIDAGSRHDTQKEEGLANLTSKLLIHGTKQRTSLQISETLDFIGANLSTRCARDVASVSMTILKKDLAVGLELLADILTSSVFPQEEIDRQKQAVIASIKAKEEEPGSIAQRKFSEALFPESRYGRPVEGNEASVNAIQQSRLKQFYERHYRPNRAILAVVGDISHQEITHALNQAFPSWAKGEAAEPYTRPTAAGSAQVVRLNKDLTQANIILGHEGVPRDHPDYYAIQVMNYILGGGGFSSRVMDSIRNERGLAYSVYSYFSAEKSHGAFELVMQTKNETAQEAISIAKREITRMREQSVSDEELKDAKDYLIGSFPLRLDTNRRVAAFLAQVEFFQLGLDFQDRYADFIRKVSKEDVLRVAKRYLYPDKLLTVIVGNLKKMGDN
ncbi:MAG TPA: pitrilysin family protein [Candidatus Binatia bacterium]|nr:pitrilysin family protein [Candidatus Binatia bacterium]